MIYIKCIPYALKYWTSTWPLQNFKHYNDLSGDSFTDLGPLKTFNTNTKFSVERKWCEQVSKNCSNHLCNNILLIVHVCHRYLCINKVLFNFFLSLYFFYTFLESSLKGYVRYFYQILDLSDYNTRKYHLKLRTYFITYSFFFLPQSSCSISTCFSAT